jgi:hypothetical protein
MVILLGITLAPLLMREPEMDDGIPVRDDYSTLDMVK